MDNKSFVKWLEEVESAVHLLPIDESYKIFSEPVTKTKLPYLGTKIPDLNKLVRQGFSFYERTDKEILEIWNYIWNHATSHDSMNIPLIYYRWKTDKLTKQTFSTFKKWFDRVDSWGHSDQLCQIYSILYGRFPEKIEPTLFKWNHDKNAWKQRASIVGTIYYASPNRKQPKRTTIFKLIKPLISHKDPYVQKGVGWQLREAYNLWPKETLAYLKKHIHDLSAISFSYATEKLSKDEKDKLKLARKQNQKK